MMRRRRKPSPARPSGDTYSPSSSGPRCRSRSRMATIVSECTARPASKVSSPQMPHMFRLRRKDASPPPSRDREAAFEEHVDRVDAVDPPDLLALLDAPRVVSDGYFHDPVSAEQQLRGQLRLEVEADA